MIKIIKDIAKELIFSIQNLFFKKKLLSEDSFKINNIIIYGPYSMIRNYRTNPLIIKIIRDRTHVIINEIFSNKNKIKLDVINIYDVGANIGLYSIAYSQIPKSRIFSFEPFPETYRYLEKNKNLNNLNNLNTYSVGLMDQEKYITMGSPMENYKGFVDWIRTQGNKIESGCKTIYHDSDNDDLIKCKFISGDNFFKQNKIQKLHYLKIDTEGSEYLVLQGMKETLTLMKPIIQLEINTQLMNNIGLDINELKDLLINLGYKNYRLFGESQLMEKSLNQLSTSSLYGSKDYVFYG